MNITLIIQLLVGGMLSLGILLAFIFVFAGAPLMQILKSRFGRAPLLLLGRKDGTCALVTGKYVGGGIDTRDHGTFLTTPKAMRPFYATSIGIAYEKVGATPTPEVIEASKRLKDKGITDVTKAKKEYGRIAGLFAKAEKKGDKKAMGELSSILDDISIIKDFFFYTMNPSQISEKVSNAIRMREGSKNRNVLMWIGGLGLAAFLIMIGAYILLSKNTCPVCPDYVSVCRNMYGVVANGTVAKSIL